MRTVAANGVGTPFELSFWESVASSNDPAQYEAYLAQYPDGTFARLAKAKIVALSPAPQPVTPAPVATVMPAVLAAPATASAPVAAPAVVSTLPAPATAAVAPLPATPAQPLTLLEQLAVVGKGPQASAPALFTETGPVPARPVLTDVAIPAIPDHFCSAVERNSFHDSVYAPAVAQADRNNEATIAHLRNVQTLHEQALAANNVAGANALAHEATTFKPVADAAYTARTAMADLFTKIMAAPVTKC